MAIKHVLFVAVTNCLVVQGQPFFGPKYSEFVVLDDSEEEDDSSTLVNSKDQKFDFKMQGRTTHPTVKPNHRRGPF